MAYRFGQYLIDHFGLNTEKIHLMGHSLGAHISGYMAKGIPKIAQITGNLTNSVLRGVIIYKKKKLNSKTTSYTRVSRNFDNPLSGVYRTSFGISENFFKFRI